MQEKISRRTFAKSALALGLSSGAIASLLAACGNDAAFGGTANTITLWDGWTGGNNAQLLNEFLQGYNKSSNKKVVATTMGWDNLFSKWVISTASGNPPDVTLCHTSEIPPYAERGILRPLDDLVRDAGIDISQIAPIGQQGAHWKNRLYAIPGDFHPFAMYYNVDMVEAAGLDAQKPPRTKEEFLHWVEKLTIRGPGKRNKQYGLNLSALGSDPRLVWHGLVYQFGGSILDEQGKATVNTQAARDALQFMYDLFHTYKVVAPGATSQGVDPIAAKQAAMWFSGPWEVDLRLQQGLRFATAPMPVIGYKPATWGNMHCFTITKQPNGDKYQDDIRFIKWFYDNYAAAARVAGTIPISPAVRESAAFVNDKHYPYYKAFIDELDYIALEPVTPYFTSLFSATVPTPVSINLEAALAGDKPIPQALSDMQQGMNGILNRQF